MADRKVSADTALTGANLATGDLFDVVDVSDSTDAATGTNKKMTAAETAIGLATTVGVVGIDKIWDAAGDLAVASGADAASKLAVGTAGGQALATDPAAAAKMAWNYPHGVEAASRGLTGSIASTYDRRTAASSVSIVAAASGTLRLFGILLPKGMSCTTITVVSGTTAANSPTHQWFGLFDSSRNVLAKTADDTSTAWGATTAKTLTIAGGPYVTTTAGWYYVGYVVTAGTVPTIEGITNLLTTGLRNSAPLAGGTSTTGLTDPASCTGQQTTITTLAGIMYVEIS